MAELKTPNINAEQLITKHLDIWTTAIEQKSSSGRGSSKKLSLHGIKKLRELILELSVRGKLVPQDPNDEPASVLLERIAAEKIQLVKDKKIKKPKALPEISEEEKPFELLQGWEWARFGSCVEINSGNSFTKTEELNKGQYIYCKVGDMNLDGNETSITTSNSFINPNGKQLKSLILSGSIIFPKRGGAIATNKKRYVNKDIFADSNVMAVKPFSRVSVEYVMLWLSSFDLASLNTGTSVPQINNKDIEPLIFAVPPLEEQKRIVAKVDELMSLCDALEAQTENSISAHQTLVEVLLEALLKAPEQTATPEQATAQFQQNWQRLSEHFDTLFTTTASIDTLKQTILQLAVMGKLVPQNPNDEPAAKLLERIAAEKAQLIKDKKIKKQKPLPEISDEEKLFTLPKHWTHTRLDNICFGITSGSTPPKDKFSENEGVPYLKVYNIRNQKVDFSYRSQFVEPSHHTTKLTRSILYPGDVIMNIVGPPLGKIAIIPNDYPEWNCNQAIVFFRPVEPLLNSYIYTYLTAEVFLESIDLIGTAGQDNISVTKSRSIVLPMPPLEEQHRIVAKVDELMALCDQLKARLTDAQTTKLHLTDAIVEQAL